jgi:hypothetical protein
MKIRVQIIERPGSDLFGVLKAAMREGDLRTFSLVNRGRKVVHSTSPGWMNWSYSEGIVTCEILSPQRPDSEWQFLRAWIGRLADKYSDIVESINVQLSPHDLAHPAKRKR